MSVCGLSDGCNICNNSNYTLKISGERNCCGGTGAAKPKPTGARCAEILSALRLSATVTDTLSSVETDGEFGVEVGVTIDVYDCSKADICERLWPSLTRAFHLECAHVTESGKSAFQGCIYDFRRETSCPGKSKKLAKERAGRIEPEPVDVPLKKTPAARRSKQQRSSSGAVAEQ